MICVLQRLLRVTMRVEEHDVAAIEGGLLAPVAVMRDDDEGNTS